MYFYKLDYVVDEVLNDLPSQEQFLLKKFAKKDVSKKEAAYLWAKINEHKWYIGERLKRDVGFHAATIDYLENFYDEETFRNHERSPPCGFSRIFQSAGSTLRSYLISKSRVLHF